MKYGLLIVVLLSGCALFEDTRMERFTARCEQIGYAKGTPEFKQCLTQLYAASESKPVVINKKN